MSVYDILHVPDPATRYDVQRVILNRSITLSQSREFRQDSFDLTAWQAVYRGKDLWGLVSIGLDEIGRLIRVQSAGEAQQLS